MPCSVGTNDAFLILKYDLGDEFALTGVVLSGIIGDSKEAVSGLKTRA